VPDYRLVSERTTLYLFGEDRAGIAAMRAKSRDKWRFAATSSMI
jgi:hypothetical protein